MRLQNIYDSIEPAIMSKVESVIADKELVFLVTDLVLGSDELKKVVNDGVSRLCEGAARLGVENRFVENIASNGHSGSLSGLNQYSRESEGGLIYHGIGGSASGLTGLAASQSLHGYSGLELAKWL